MTRSGNDLSVTALPIRRAVAAFVLAGLVSLALPVPASAAPPLDSLPDKAPSSLTQKELSMSPEGIRLRFEQRPLGEVLQAIRNRTEVDFALAPGTRDMPVTAGFDAPDWANALRRLLRDFDHVLLYDDDGNLERVVVTGHRDAAQSDDASAPEIRRSPEEGSEEGSDGPPSRAGEPSSPGPPDDSDVPRKGPPDETPYQPGPPESTHHPGPPGS